MPTETQQIHELANQEYKYGFYTDVEADAVPPGLNEDIIRLISEKKGEPEFMLEWRLKAYRHWLTLEEPHWSNVSYPPIDYQSIIYYSAPSKQAKTTSLEDVDPDILETYRKLGIPLEEQGLLAGVAVDAVFDSVSVATTFKEKLAELGIIFCSFSEAVRNHPDLVKKYLGSVVPHSDNFLRLFECGRLLGRVFLLRPERRPLPHGAVHLLPDQRREDGPVRAHVADRAMKGPMSATWKAARRPCVTRTSCTPRSSSWSRSITRRSSTPRFRTGIRATTRAEAGSTTS